MIYKGKKLKIEFFDKSLNGTVTGTFTLKKDFELDTSKRNKLGTQLRNLVKKSESLSKHIGKTPIAMVELFVQGGDSITTIIDNRNK